MSAGPRVAPHGYWTGHFDLAALFRKAATPTYPASHDGCIYWLESRADEGGRTVLMQRGADQREQCLTPAGLSLRSRVHEYGGCPYTLHAGVCYFVNDADQRIYRQALRPGAPAEPVTPDTGAGPGRRYVDLSVSGAGDCLFCVMECEAADPEADNANLLAAVRLEPDTCHAPQVIEEGCDFYACLVLDRQHDRLAWIEWDHPNMPWDESRALLAHWVRDATGVRLERIRRVAGGADTSVCQLAFDDDGDLLLAMDGAAAPGRVPDFWNLYRWRDGRFTALTADEREYGAPHWVFGERRYVVLRDALLAVRSGPEGDELVRVDKHGGGAERVASDAVEFRQLVADGADQALLVSAAPDRSPTLARWRRGGLEPIRQVAELLPAAAVSRPRAVCYESGQGEAAHAWFYPPCNPGYRAPADTAPPLLVMVHGGPTARASSALDLSRQYWTGLGFAVLDVNYRGSSGYGRAYRQSLLGNWGLSDTEDIVRGVEHVVTRAWVDPRRVFIRGRSAGGYAVLSALTRYPQTFAAGACYYGIGNLGTLAQITHKFEGRYTDRLIGEVYRAACAGDPHSRYHERSPIHFVAAIRCPLIVFQGLEDRIVPPAVSREIASALEAQGLEHDYVEYPGEGHGFRSSATNIDALERETEFYRRVLNGNGAAA